MSLATKLRRAGNLLVAAALALAATRSAQAAASPKPAPTPTPPGAPKPSTDKMPVHMLHFELACAGAAPSQFKEASGIDDLKEVVMFKAPGYKGDAVKAGAVKYSTIVLKGGGADAALFKWRDLVVKGDLAQAKRTCDLTALDADGSAVARYALRDAYPTKLTTVGERSTGAADELTLEVGGVTKLK